MTLDELGLKYSCDKSSGWHSYCQHYQKYLSDLRDQPVTMLEQGVQFGSSMKMWADYFHNGEIYGIDIAQDFQTDNPHIHLFQLDQSDRAAWSHFMPGLTFDFICDDAGHYAKSQSVAFECLWPRLKPHGLYAIEDLWTLPDPLWKQQGPGSSFITQLVWWLNKSGKQYHGRPGGVSEPLNAMESSIDFIHLYPGLVIIKKK